MLLKHSLFAVILSGVFAGGPSPRTLADVAPPAGENSAFLTPEQRTAALEFAREHHPQLNSLIRRLEKRDAGEYERALSDVSKTCERLTRLKPRDPERYEVDLALWKADSRIRLLAARMANDERASLENQIRSLLNQRTDLRLQQLALERKRLTGRIEKLDDQTRQLASDRDALIDKEVERLRKSVRNRTSTVGRRQKSNATDRRTPPKQTGSDSSESRSPPAPKTKANPRT